MIRKAIDTLSDKLSDGLALSNSRLETLCLLVIGIASVRTVNLSHISGEMPTQAKVESTYRRLQRFFQHVALGQDWSARLVVHQLGLMGSWHLCLDRTNWKIGRKDVNLLVLAVATRRYRVPLIWTVLGKAGNSNTGERTALMTRYLDLFGATSVKYLLADREFIGLEWLTFLVGQDGLVARISNWVKIALTRRFVQATTSNLARPSPVILLRMWVPILASVFWLGKLRAFSLGPMTIFQRPICVSARLR